jgi:tRNA (cmo5U34)-methyltransferase
MSTFSETSWAQPAYATEYLDHADHYIPERAQLFEILQSFYRRFMAPRGAVSVCDLGCGDGILSSKLLDQDPQLKLTLVDGSGEMLAAARKKFSSHPRVSFIQKSFQELIEDSRELGQFDLIVSAFAIHHLERVERRALFTTVFQHLRPGGGLLNIETALASHADYTEWYYVLWQEWIDARDARLGLKGAFHNVPQKARDNPDNKYSPLSEQLQDLESAGFTAADCHYKNGIFTIYTALRRN